MIAAPKSPPARTESAACAHECPLAHNRQPPSTGEGNESNGLLCRCYFFLGTLAPFLRASDRPIAMACFRLFTRPPFPPFPDLSVPRFLRRMALSTVFPAALPYFLRPRFLGGI